MVGRDNLSEKEEQHWTARVRLAEVIDQFGSVDGFARPRDAFDPEQAAFILLKPSPISIGRGKPLPGPWRVGCEMLAELAGGNGVRSWLQPLSNSLDLLYRYWEDIFGIVVAYVILIDDAGLRLAVFIAARHREQRGEKFLYHYLENHSLELIL